MLIRAAGGRARRLAGVLAVAALSGFGVAGCSGDDSSDPPAPTTDANGLTAPGTSLGLGDAATVDFKAGKHESEIKVTVNHVQKRSVKDLSEFQLKNAARQSGVYYVRASVRNSGSGDLGGAFVKLYAKVSDTLVVQPVIFGSTFGKCDYRPLPKPFKAGKRADVCMVMLAPKHGTVSAVQWRFAGDQAPITWELS
jgi:hypothetical protein